MTFKRLEPVIVLLTLLALLTLILAVSGRFIILGGEGNYITDFRLIREIDSSTWGESLTGTGYANPVVNNLPVIFDFFSLMQRAGLPLKAVNTVIVFLNYALPFLAMYWLVSRVLKERLTAAYVISLFYIVNPLIAYHLQGVMIFNTAPLYVLPVIFGWLYRHYLDRPRLFLGFGVLSAFFAYSFANIPYLATFQIFLVMSLVLVPVMRRLSVDFKTLAANFFALEAGFLLFNAWWLINLVRYQQYDIGTYTKEFVINWVRVTSGFSDIIFKILTLRTLITFEKGSFYPDYFYHPLVSLVLAVPIFLIVWNLLKTRDPDNQKHGPANYTIAFLLLLTIFLNKGMNGPFAAGYEWLLNNVPLFYVFKTPFEKFTILFVFLVSLALVYVLRQAGSRWPLRLMVLYLAVCSLPMISLNFIPDVKFAPDKYISRRYQAKQEYAQAQEYINSIRLDNRVLSLPGSRNYQVTMLNRGGNKYYRGLDPLMYGLNKPFIAAYTGPTGNQDLLFASFSTPETEKFLLNLYGVKTVVINRDIFPAYGFREKESIGQLLRLFNRSGKRTDFGPVAVIDLNGFLPRFYTPDTAILTDKTPSDLAKIITGANAGTRTALFFQKQNTRAAYRQLNNLSDTARPVLEFRKISPTKYRVRVHGGAGRFPLIFSETFNRGWKAYPVVMKPRPVAIEDLVNYAALANNEDTQATKGELAEFLDRGLVSDLGDSGAIGFISKNYGGTVQNDNLPAGCLYETWFKKPLAESRHLTVNGYANAWLIDTDTLCNGESAVYCRRNTDGTFDLELVVGFWPERLVYLGLLISTLSLFTSLAYVLDRTMKPVIK